VFVLIIVGAGKWQVIVGSLRSVSSLRSGCFHKGSVPRTCRFAGLQSDGRTYKFAGLQRAGRTCSFAQTGESADSPILQIFWTFVRMLTRFADLADLKNTKNTHTLCVRETSRSENFLLFSCRSELVDYKCVVVLLRLYVCWCRSDDFLKSDLVSLSTWSLMPCPVNSVWVELWAPSWCPEHWQLMVWRCRCLHSGIGWPELLLIVLGSFIV